MAFTRFMASRAGRGVRVVAGLALIAVGIAVGGMGGIVVAVVGVLPLAAGALDVCLFAPFIHVPLRGREVRASH
jgi:hypothetical protein